MTWRNHVVWKTASISAAGLLASAVAMADPGDPLMDCHDQVVHYSEPTLVPLARHISIKALPPGPREVRPERDPEFIPESPQETAAFNRLVVMDLTQPGPRSNAIEVFSTKGPSVAWRIEAGDLRDDMRLRWLNEDLLFVQAWWGRIVSTDLIFQLSTGRFIYAQEANYGQLTVPCKEHDQRTEEP